MSKPQACRVVSDRLWKASGLESKTAFRLPENWKELLMRTNLVSFNPHLGIRPSRDKNKPTAHKLTRMRLPHSSTPSKLALLSVCLPSALLLLGGVLWLFPTGDARCE